MIFPAIDLMDGGCVRLYKGDFEQRTDYDISPLEMARQFQREGAEWIHIVDLDGAKNRQSEQSDLIGQIARESGLKVQTGGGIRDLKTVENILAKGIERVVIGSLALSNPDLLKSWIKKLGGERFVLALDVNIEDDGTPYPTLHGWTENANNTLWEVLDDYSQSGIQTILVTDIAKDGVLAGSNTELYAQIIERFPDMDLITSGGVGSLADVKALKTLDPYGIIIGKALYESKFTLAEAIQC